MLLQWDLNNKDLHSEYVRLYDDEFEIYFESIVQNILSFSKVKVLTISGPTSSGKTTTALKLASKLKTGGINTQVISMDDFYIDRDDVPKKSDGTPDFETIDALDIDLLIRCLNEAIIYNKTSLPKYNFKISKQYFAPSANATVPNP